jgi:hypothetical protein|tara:strand:- start:48 stop:212 length:165 start_codon:yes stop_codon:yes gene_type:complete
MKHFTNNAKEILKVMENNKYRQGRSEEQVKGSYIGAFISIIGLIVIAIIAFIIS